MEMLHHCGLINMHQGYPINFFKLSFRKKLNNGLKISITFEKKIMNMMINCNNHHIQKVYNVE